MNTRAHYQSIRRLWRMARRSGDVAAYMECVTIARRITGDLDAGLTAPGTRNMDWMKHGRTGLRVPIVWAACTRWMKTH